MAERVHYAEAGDYLKAGALWGGTLFVLLLAGLLQHRRRRSVPSGGSVCPAEAGKSGGSRHVAQSSTSTLGRIRCTLAYQLPPRDLWVAVCGGLSVGDLLAVCIWFAFVFWYFLDNLEAKLAKLDAQKQDFHQSTSTDAFFGLSRQKAVAKSLGTCMRAQLLLILYPVQRSSLLAWVFGTCYSSIIKYHRWMGWGLVATTCMHGFLYSAVWLSLGEWKVKGLQDASNAAGVVAALVAAVIASTSTTWFRRWWYHAFWMVHVCCMPLFFTAVVVHDPAIAYSCLPLVLLYCLDRAFRFWQHHTNASRVSVADGGLVVRGNMLTLRTLWSSEGPHGVRAGQTVYVSCPTISLFHAHPFSIADVQPWDSAPRTHPAVTHHELGRGSTGEVALSVTLPHQHGPTQQQLNRRDSLDASSCGDVFDDMFDSSMLGESRAKNGTEVVVVTLHMRVTGYWTQKLQEFALEHPTHPLQVQMEGPYDTEVSEALVRWGSGMHCQAKGGHAHPLPLAPEALVMVSGGIGITPLLGILRGLARHHQWHGLERPSLRRTSHKAVASTGEEGEGGQEEHHTHKHLVGVSLSSSPSGGSSGAASPSFEVRSAPGGATAAVAVAAAAAAATQGGRGGKGRNSSEIAQLPSSRTGAGEGAHTPQVYLVYCCRHIEELQLLDADLLEEACRPNSWLHLHIAYTGFELEQQEGATADLPAKGLLVGPSPSLPPFPRGQTPRLLYPSLGRHPLVHVAHAALVYLGAGLAGLLFPAAVCALLFSSRLELPGELMWGVLVAVPMGLGAFLTPLALMSFIDGRRRRRWDGPFGALSGSSSGGANSGGGGGSKGGCVMQGWSWWRGWLRGEEHPPAHVPGSKPCAAVAGTGVTSDILAGKQPATAGSGNLSDVRVLPGYMLTWNDSGSRVALHRGRPHLPSLLRFIQGHHGSGDASNSTCCEHQDVETGGGGTAMHAQQKALAQSSGAARSAPHSAPTCRLPPFTGLPSPSPPFNPLPLDPLVHAGSSSTGRGGAVDLPGCHHPAATHAGAHGASNSEQAILPDTDADAAPLLAQPKGADMGMHTGQAAPMFGARVEGQAGKGLEGGRMQVWVGGPEALWQSACAACEALNKRGRAPGLEAVRVAHIH